MKSGGTLINFLFLAVGVGLLAASLYFFAHRVFFIVTTKEAAGTVVALVEVGTSKGGTHAPVVRFQTVSGQDVRFTGSAGFASPFGYHIGDHVRVLYNPSRPSEADIDAPTANWGRVFIPLLLGFCFSFLGIEAFRPGRNPPQPGRQSNV